MNGIGKLPNTLTWLPKHHNNRVTSGSAGRAGAPYTEAVPSATGPNPPEVTTPVSAPDQGTDIRSGVGPRMPNCGSPLLLTCVVKVNYKEWDGLNAEEEFPQGVSIKA